MLTPEQMIDLQKAAIVLTKAKAKSMSKHFKKSAAHHEANAEDDTKCEMAHKAHAEVHEKKMGKADDPDHEVHKAAAALHKTLAGFAAKMAKRETEYAAHCMKMSEACENDDAKKVLKALDFTDEEITALLDNLFGEEKPIMKTETPAEVKPEVKPAAAAPAVVTAPSESPSLDKAVGDQLNKAMELSFKRILDSPEFGKRMDEVIAEAMIKRLGGTPTVPTAVKTFPIERTQDSLGVRIPGVALQNPSTSDLPSEFAHLTQTEDAN